MNATYRECYPDAAQYREGQIVSVILKMPPETLGETVEIRVSNLDGFRQKHTFEIGQSSVFELGKFPRGMYGVDCFFEKETIAYTAFDVTDGTERIVRYGFLTDFGPEEKDDEDIVFADKMHLTAIQFYDWMYRHDQLVYDGEEYDNPLGISISNAVIRRKIALCKKIISDPLHTEPCMLQARVSMKHTKAGRCIHRTRNRSRLPTGWYL